MNRFPSFFVSLALAATLLFASAPSFAGVYVVDETDPVADFCDAVTKAKKDYCPNVKLKCKKVLKTGKKKAATFIKSARACYKDVSVIRKREALTALRSFDKYRSVLCCTQMEK